MSRAVAKRASGSRARPRIVIRSSAAETLGTTVLGAGTSAVSTAIITAASFSREKRRLRASSSHSTIDAA